MVRDHAFRAEETATAKVQRQSLACVSNRKEAGLVGFGELDGEVVGGELGEVGTGQEIQALQTLMRNLNFQSPPWVPPAALPIALNTILFF